MCETVFDKGGNTIPLENVNRTERASDGRLRVFMKNSGNVVMLPEEHVEEFLNDLKQFQALKHAS